MRPADCRVVKGAERSAASCLQCSSACCCLPLLNVCNARLKDPVDSFAFGALKPTLHYFFSCALPTAGLPGAPSRAHHPTRRAARCAFKGLVLLKIFEICSWEQVDSVALGVIKPSLHSFLSCAPSTAVRVVKGAEPSAAPYARSPACEGLPLLNICNTCLKRAG